MEKTEIKAVEMTRRIRAANAERLRNATPEERIRYYKEKARWAERYKAPEVQTVSTSDVIG